MNDPFDYRAAAPNGGGGRPAAPLTRPVRAVNVSALPLVILVHNQTKAEFYGNGEVGAEDVPDMLRLLAEIFEQQHPKGND